MVYALVLGTSTARFEGSSPSSSTKKTMVFLSLLYQAIEKTIKNVRILNMEGMQHNPSTQKKTTDINNQQSTFANKDRYPESISNNNQGDERTETNNIIDFIEKSGEIKNEKDNGSLENIEPSNEVKSIDNKEKSENNEKEILDLELKIERDTNKLNEERRKIGMPPTVEEIPSLSESKAKLEKLKVEHVINKLRENFKEKYKSLRETAPIFKDIKNKNLEDLNEGAIQTNTLTEFKILLEESGLSDSEIFQSLNEMNTYALEAEKSGLRVDNFSLVVRREIKADGTYNISRIPTVSVSRPEHVDPSAFDRVARANNDLFISKAEDGQEGVPSLEAKELVKKNKKGEVLAHTLLEFKQKLLDFGYSKEQTDEILNHEEAHALKAYSLGVKVMGYGIRYNLDESDVHPEVYLQPFAMIDYEKGQGKFHAEITSIPDDLSKGDLEKLGIFSEKDLKINLTDIEKLSVKEKQKRFNDIISTLGYVQTDMINKKLSTRSLYEIKDLLLLKPDLISNNTTESKIYRKIERALGNK